MKQSDIAFVVMVTTGAVWWVLGKREAEQNLSRNLKKAEESE